MLSEKHCKQVRLFTQEKIEELVGLSSNGTSSKCVPMEKHESWGDFTPYAIAIDTNTDEGATVHGFSWETAYRLEKRPRAITRDVVKFKIEDGVLKRSAEKEVGEDDYRVRVPHRFDSTQDCQDYLDTIYFYLKNYTLSTYVIDALGQGKFLLDGKCVALSQQPVTEHKFFLLVVPKKR
jgi:hypothetical protein